MLRSRGVHHTASVVTKLKFDSNAAYPKVIFSPDRWLEQSELAVVAPIAKSEEVKALLDGTFTLNNGDGTRTEPFEQGDPPAPAATPKPAPAAAKPAPAPKPKPEITPAPKPDPVVETVAEQAAAVETPAVATDVPEDVAALLADWG
jgi:outer membrane biosynthesis protein TonB